jgi:hypothetical protein
MKRILSCLGIVGIAILAGGIGACSDDSNGELAVQGTVSQAITVDNARAVAVGQDGRTFWTYLDAHRDFTLRLPTGQSYRIYVSNGRASGGRAMVAHLALRGAAGKTPWLGVTATGTVDLGALRPASASGSGGVTIQCESCKGDDHGHDDAEKANHDADNECHEKHHGKPKDHDDDDVCEHDGDTELEPSNDPGKACEDKGEHDHDQDVCAAPDGGADAGAVDAGGGGAAGAECLVTADCSSALVCLAGHCAPPPSGGGTGAECLVDANCAAGLRCVAGLCSP